MQDRAGNSYGWGAEGGGPREERPRRRVRAAMGEEILRRLNGVWNWSIKSLLYWGCLSVVWYTTCDGVLQLIEANAGPVSVTKGLVIGFAVLLLVLAIGYFLDELLKPMSLRLRVLYTGMYLLMVFISVAFSFGFYWKQMYAKTVTRELASSGIVQVQNSLGQAQRRLENVKASLENLAAISARKAEEEDKKGTSCPDSPGPTKGPRYRLRMAEAGEFAAAASLIGSKVETLTADIRRLGPWLMLVQQKTDTDPATGAPLADPDGRPVLDPDGTRNTFLDKVDGKVNEVIGLYEVMRTDTALAAMRQKFEQRSKQETFTDGGKQFTCRDPELQGALAAAAADIGALPAVKSPGIRGIEGAKANIEAFERLWTTVWSVATAFKLPPTPEDIAERRRNAVKLANEGKTRPDGASEERPGLSGADSIPLIIAVFIDLILFTVAVNRPFDRFGHFRTEVLDREHGKTAEALQQLLGRIVPADFHRHYVFRHWGEFYIAVPERLDDGTKDVAAAFTAMEGLYFLQVSPLGGVMGVARKLRRRGSKLADIPDNAGFVVYRMFPDAMPRLMRDLLLSGNAAGAGSRREPGPKGDGGHEAQSPIAAKV